MCRVRLVDPEQVRDAGYANGADAAESLNHRLAKEKGVTTAQCDERRNRGHKMRDRRVFGMSMAWKFGLPRISETAPFSRRFSGTDLRRSQPSKSVGVHFYENSTPTRFLY